MKKVLLLLFVFSSILSIAGVSFNIKKFDLPTEQKISIALEHNQNDLGANAAEIVIKLYNFNNYDTLISSLTYLFEEDDDYEYDDVYDDYDNEDNYDDEYDDEPTFNSEVPPEKDDFISIIKETGFDKLLFSLKENLKVINDEKNIKVNLSNEAAIQFQKKLFSNPSKILNNSISFDYRDFKLLKLLVSSTTIEVSNDEVFNDLDNILNESDEELFKEALKKYLNEKSFEQLSAMFNEISNLDPEGKTSALDIIHNYLKVFAKNDGEDNWLSLKDIFKTNIFDSKTIAKDIDNFLNQTKLLLKEIINIYDFENSTLFLKRSNKDLTDILLNNLSNTIEFKDDKLTYLLDYDLNKEFLLITANNVTINTPLELLKQLYISLPDSEFNLYFETKEKNIISKTTLYCNFLNLKSNFEFTDLNIKVSPDIIRYTMGVIFSSFFKNLDEKYLYLLPNMISLITRDNDDLVFSLRLNDSFSLTSITPNFFSKENIESIINDFNSPDELLPSETSTNTTN